MGGPSWSSSDWGTYSKKHVDGKTASTIYKNDKLIPELDPANVVRESRNSEAQPNATPIAIGLDVTGSMDNVLENVVKGLNRLITELYDRKPVTDPQIMFMGIGDVHVDRVPLQTSQYESDIRVAEQLTNMYFERGGGGNDSESYNLAWYFANFYTDIDSIKDGRKGFLFTLGDECPPKDLKADQLRRVFGDNREYAILSNEELLNELSKKYEVFHLIIEEGSNCKHYEKKCGLYKRWTDLMGERAIKVSDLTKIPEIIVSTLELLSGKSHDEIISSWDGTTGIVVNKAISGLTSSTEGDGLVEFK